MIGFPFDSQVTYDPEGTPIFDRAISSAPLRQLIKSVLSNGVLPNPSTNLQVQPGTGMSVVVNPGFAVIEGGMKYEESQRTLVVQASDTTYDRIDTVVLRWNDNANARSCDFYIMQGVPASSPVRPALNREGSVYEIGLADLFIVANSSAISAARITDTRYEAERCGIISSIAEFDSDTIYKQVQADLAGFKTEEQEAFLAWFENIKDQLSEDAAGNLQAQIGTRSELETDEKSDLVKAINEVNTKAKNGGKNLVGDEFDEAKTYAIGDYCIYKNVLYVFISAKNAGAWDATLVEATTVADELSEQNKNIPFAFGIDENGNYGYIKAGADSVTPFLDGYKVIEFYVGENKDTITLDSKYSTYRIWTCSYSGDGGSGALQYIRPQCSGCSYTTVSEKTENNAASGCYDITYKSGGSFTFNRPNIAVIAVKV